MTRKTNSKTKAITPPLLPSFFSSVSVTGVDGQVPDPDPVSVPVPVPVPVEAASVNVKTSRTCYSAILSFNGVSDNSLGVTPMSNTSKILLLPHLYTQVHSSIVTSSSHGLRKLPLELVSIRVPFQTNSLASPTANLAMVTLNS